MSELNIFQRINRVMQAVGYIKKDSSVQNKYRAVSHDNLIATIRSELVENGIVIRTTQKTGSIIQMRDQEKSITNHLYQGTYQIDLVNIDNPEDIFSGEIQAHAADTLDKAPGKCITYAVKAFLLKAFVMETGIDDESRSSYEPPAFTDMQKDEFDTILDRRDGLAYAVFSRKHGPEIMSALSKTFPEGKISSLKKLCKELESEGWDKLNEYARLIAEATDREDKTALAQYAEELSKNEKMLLAGILRPEDITALKKAREL